MIDDLIYKGPGSGIVVLTTMRSEMLQIHYDHLVANKCMQFAQFSDLI